MYNKSSEAGRHRLEVRTTGFQPVNRGSIPRGATMFGAEVAELVDAHV
jgi:hypothetical protein